MSLTNLWKKIDEEIASNEKFINLNENTESAIVQLTILRFKEESTMWDIIRDYVQSVVEPDLLTRHQILNTFAKIKERTGLTLITNEKQLEGPTDETHSIKIFNGFISYLLAK